MSTRALVYEGLGAFNTRALPKLAIVRQARKPPHLRPHEEQMLRLLCEGLTTKEASAMIGITPGTGKQYMDHARKRMGMRTTCQMVAWYCRGQAAPLNLLPTTGTPLST